MKPDDADGRDLCPKLRRDDRRMPVIMLTGADGEQDVVRGLDASFSEIFLAHFFSPFALHRRPSSNDWFVDPQNVH